MAIGNYAIVSGGIVSNIVVWDGNAQGWQPPGGSTANPLPVGSPVSIDWTTSDGVNYVAPTTKGGS